MQRSEVSGAALRLCDPRNHMWELCVLQACSVICIHALVSGFSVFLHHHNFYYLPNHYIHGATLIESEYSLCLTEMLWIKSCHTLKTCRKYIFFLLSILPCWNKIMAKLTNVNLQSHLKRMSWRLCLGLPPTLWTKPKCGTRTQIYLQHLVCIEISAGLSAPCESFS